MAKSNLSKKALINNLLVCILYHNIKIDLLRLLEKLKNSKIKILIVVDGKLIIKNKKKIQEMFVNIKFLYVKKNTTISYKRNTGLKYAGYKSEIILFLDSDIIPSSNLIKSHIKYHKIYKKIPILGGAVIPSFYNNRFNFFEFLDGILSWFTSIKSNSNKIIEPPYHLPTCNMSIKIELAKKYKILFDNNLVTGEDVDFCNQFRKFNNKIMYIKNSEVYHDDRKFIIPFIKHHWQWGRHQYYTLYEKKFSHKLGKFSFFLLFSIFYPFLFPMINFISTILVITPWINLKKRYFFILIPVYIVHLLKGIATYYEFIKKIINNYLFK
tara:strand:+ start:418 stop:1392 length:975 start_codon:yes stop_codon:yes gene_type:complete